MSRKILLTSFDTWLPHQKSNASDDLLNEISQTTDLSFITVPSPSLTFLRRLPVDIQQASELAIACIDQLNPDLIICCGMAEKRQKLTIESQATFENTVIKNWVDIHQLIPHLKMTDISHDAGKFVCEGLYYSTLKHLRDRHLSSRCIFVHVPLINADNIAAIKADFFYIIRLLA